MSYLDIIFYMDASLLKYLLEERGLMTIFRDSAEKTSERVAEEVELRLPELHDKIMSLGMTYEMIVV